MPPETRQGRVPEGWSKQGIVIPDAVWSALRSLGDKHGYGSLKSLCTVGMAMVAGMPEHLRTGLLKWVAQASVDGPGALTPEAIYAEFERLWRTDMGNAVVLGPVKPMPVVPVNGDSPEAITHKVVRILEPTEPKKRKGAA